MEKHFSSLFAMNAPHIVEVLCTENQQILPAQSFKDGKQMPLHNMLPFLSDEELAKEMVI